MKRIIILLACIMFLFGCQSNEQSVHMQFNGQALGQFTPTVLNGEAYYPVSSILETLGYYVHLNDEKTELKAGYTDVIYSIKEGDKTALVEDNHVPLNFPVAKVNNELCLTGTDLEKLLSNSYVVDATDGNIAITTKVENLFEENDDISNLTNLTFEEEKDLALAEPQFTAQSADKINSIIRTARRYIGTPYVFGAPSGETRVFDCSSFTEHVFESHGIELPRVARAQARQGIKVSVANLRKGDLLFFSWPGRFSSDKIVGHVAIYMGGGYMIHTTPNEGVHIANLAESEYWKTNYLGAKRIIR